MSEIIVNNWDQLNWVWLIAALLLVLLAAGLRARRQSADFATPDRLAAILPEGVQSRRWYGLLSTLLAMLCCVLALLDIRWGKTTREVPQMGLEIVFTMDVSRSMLAEDVVPNRLERAKQDIRDLIASMAGHRIGLVAFAGEANRILPLTTHYEDFKQQLAMVSPLDVRRGGTNLGEALITAADSFSQNNRDHKVIVLLTDGEDHESDPIAVASQLHREHGIRVFTIGLGDMQTGTLIPDTFVSRSGRSGDNFLRHQGELIRSRLDGKILDGIARGTGSVFIPAGTRQVDLPGFYRRHLEPLGQTEFDSAEIDVHIPRYQWFLALGLALLVWESLFNGQPTGFTGTGRVVDRVPAAAANSLAVPLFAILAWLLLEGAAGCSLLHAELPGQSSSEKTDAEGDRQVKPAVTRQPDETLEPQILILEERLRRDFDPRLAYNLGLLYATKQDWAQASVQFSAAAGSEQVELAAQARYNLGNLEYHQALNVQQENRNAAGEHLNRAIEHYRAALRLNPQDLDARINTELAIRLRQSLTSRQPPSPDSSGQPDSESPDRNRSSDADSSPESDPAQPPDRSDAEAGEAEDQQTGNSGGEQQQATEQSDRQAGESGSEETNNEREQREPGSKTGNQSDQSLPQTRESSGDATGTDNSQDQRTDSAPGSPGESPPAGGDRRNDPNESPENGGNSLLESLTETDKSPLDKKDPLPRESDSSAPEATNPEGALTGLAPDPSPSSELPSLATNGFTSKMTEVEAAKMLQAIRDRELLRRLQQLRRQQARRIPVERDW